MNYKHYYFAHSKTFKEQTTIAIVVGTTNTTYPKIEPTHFFLVNIVELSDLRQLYGWRTNRQYERNN